MFNKKRLQNLCEISAKYQANHDEIWTPTSRPSHPSEPSLIIALEQSYRQIFEEMLTLERTFQSVVVSAINNVILPVNIRPSFKRCSDEVF